MKRCIKKVPSIISLFLCFLLIFNSSLIAQANSLDYFTVDSISIIERHGILEGKAVQLAAVLSPDSASKNAVEWSSSNPNVITCTPEGIIKGVSAGDYAIITCKSKYGDVADSIKVYCVKPIGNPIESEFVNPITIIYKQPSTGSIASFHYSVSFFTVCLSEHLLKLFYLL